MWLRDAFVACSAATAATTFLLPWLTYPIIIEPLPPSPSLALSPHPPSTLSSAPPAPTIPAPPPPPPPHFLLFYPPNLKLSRSQ